MPSFTLFDIELRIHHFYRHEQSLEKRFKSAVAIEQERFLKSAGREKEHRLRWISYFHLADSVESRLQSVLTKDELEKVLRSFLPHVREVLSWSLKVVDEES
jgi:hypothetical protein